MKGPALLILAEELKVNKPVLATVTPPQGDLTKNF